MDRSSLSLILSLILHALLLWVAWTAWVPDRPLADRPTEVTYLEPSERERPSRATQIDANPAAPDKSVTEDELHDTAELISNLNRRYKKQMVARQLPGLNRPATGLKIPTVQYSPPTDHAAAGKGPGEKTGERDDGGELNFARLGGAGPREPLFPSSSSAARGHVPWVEFGDVSVLNTDRNRYFAFYNRMSGQVGNRWVGLVRELIERTPRERLEKMSTADRRTRVEITLDRDGDFKNARFEGVSGFPDLDYTGVEAFRMAAPLVNPPRGMVGSDGLIHIHVVFEIIMRPPMLQQAY